ncbi:ribonuclease H-like domain-containing protein [Tanacetum coccineum]
MIERDLNTAEDLRLSEEDNDCMKIKTCEEIFQDYTLWDVIENGNSFKPTARTTANADGTSTSMIPGPVTTEEKVQKKNDVKARNAKTLFDAIQTRFGGNDDTRKTQKTLLKHMYENFNAPSTESLDYIFNMLHKIVSQLAILGENISQEDLKLKFLRSLPSEWNTHVVVWRNKSDLDTMSIDDLYNNFKIVEQEVKRTITSSSNSNSSSQNRPLCHLLAVPMKLILPMFKLVLLTLLSQLVHEDLEQIHEDDLEEIDLKWQLALLSMRARRYFQRTGKKITINGSDTAGYDKSKVECFNCHKMGHFARECRGPRNQDNRNRNQDSSRRTVNVEETSSKAMVAIDGAGFDWSFMADEEVPTNMALMAFSDSEVYNDKTCTNTCLKSFETLKTQYDNLRVEFNKSEFNLATYKRGLASVEEQLVFYKKNEVMFCDQIAVLKRDTSFKDSEINALKSEIEKLKKEKESNQIKINKFENASKSLDKLIGSQISNNSRKGIGLVSYNDVPPPPTGLFAPPTINLSNSGLEEFQQPEFECYGPKASKSVCKDTSNEVRKTPDALLGEKLVLEKEKQNVFPTKIESVKQQEKPARKPLGGDFVMYNKACFVCGSFDHVHAHCNYHQREGIVNGNNYTRVNYIYFTKKAHMTPKEVLMKTGLKLLNTARPVNTAHPKTIVYSARPMSCFSKLAQSTVKMPYQSRTTLTNKNFNQKFNTAKENFYTAKPKAVNTVRPTSAVVNAVRANQVHPKKEYQGYVDSGWSRHMTGNMSYLTDFKEFDRGYVTFRGGARGGRITGKGTLKTGKLDFEDVYFVKELQFNIFSVSRMCDKKNSVLFTDTACFVLSPDFKLPDESQVLLKVPRKNNMYNVDMKNIIPKERLTCLVAKATLDESMLWQRRLGHINFKTINKLVNDNLVRGLPAKHFENNQTYVACLKGKQHKVSSSKDETSGILKNFITEIENLVDKKVKIIRCDNRIKFKNRVMIEFGEKKDIKREFGVARTPPQNGVAERRNRTLIEAARTMLDDFKLPTTFWAKAVNTACYVQNKVIIVKPHNKTLYELFRGRTPTLSFMRPFRCHVTILNTLDHLGKFVGKSNDGFFVRYSLTSKAFRVYNIRTRKVEENLHIRFLENKSIVTGDGPKWLFDIDSLTKSMNYVPFVAGTNSNDFAGSEESNGTSHTSKETEFSQDYIVMPLWKDGSMFDYSSKNSSDDELQPSSNAEKKDDEGVSKASRFSDQEQPESSTPNINTTGPSINTASVNFKTGSLNINIVSPTVITTRDAEVAQSLQKRLMHQKDREMVKVHQAAQGFTDAEWDDILARVTADEDLVQQLQAGEKYSEEDLPMKLVELVNQEQKHKIEEASGSGEEQSAEKKKELSKEELQKLMMIVPMEEVYVEALQVKYPIIDWEVYIEESRKYWKIIRVGDHTEAYQTFDDMLKKFDRRGQKLFEPDIDDILWKLQRYMHDPLTWRLYDTCGVHHVSTDKGHDIFMLVEKDYPLTRGLMTVMLANKLQVDQSSEMANEALRKSHTRERTKTRRDLNIAEDLRLPEEDNDCIKIKTREEIFTDTLAYTLPLVLKKKCMNKVNVTRKTRCLNNSKTIRLRKGCGKRVAIGGHGRGLRRLIGLNVGAVDDDPQVTKQVSLPARSSNTEVKDLE